MTNYNKTQLSPDTTFERHVYHRDQFAHYLRWTHILKNIKIGMNLLDFGCGSGNLCEVAYRNKFKLNSYVGIDIRQKTIQSANEKFLGVSWAQFMVADLCSDEISIPSTNWDIISCLEVIEHIGKKNGPKLLQNIKNQMNDSTIFFLSTPVYDPSVGAADNHIIDGEIGEYGYDELKTLLSEYFIIEKVYGTFASQKDYKPFMNEWQTKYFESVKDYFDSNLVSNLMAPMFPEQSRNCLWRLKSKGNK